MALLELILLILAFVLFLIATFNHPGLPARWNLVAGGLASFTLAAIIWVAENGHITVH
jgi:hypothetical protein